MTDHERSEKLAELERLKAKGESAYSEMYETHDAGKLAWHKDVAENAFIEAARLARELGLENDASACAEKLKLIQKAYRQLR